MKCAGDVAAQVLGQRVVVLRQVLQVDPPVGQRREDRAGERRHPIDQLGHQRALDLVLGVEPVELPQAIVELDRERMRDHGAHLFVRQHLDRHAEGLHEPLQIEVVAEKIELDQRLRRVGGLQRHRPARHRLEQRGPEIRHRKPERAPRRLALHVDVHVVARRAGQAGGIAKARHRMGADALGLPLTGFLQHAEKDNGVVRQVLPNAGHVGPHLDAVLLQVRGRADAHPHQKMRRVDAAQRADHLTRAECLCLATDLRRHAGGAATVEGDADDMRAVDDGEVVSRPHRGVEIADRGGGALVRPVALRHHAIAVAEIRVHVGEERHLPLLRKGLHRLRQRRPILLLGAADRDRAVLAVLVTAEIEIVLELAIERQHVVPAETLGAEFLPLRVIVGRAAVGDHPHHRRAAAHDAALRHGVERRIVLAAPVNLQLGPEIVVVVIGGRVGIEHIGRLPARRRVRPGFEQQHGAARFRRETVGQHASGDASAHDDGVEALGHGCPIFRGNSIAD